MFHIFNLLRQHDTVWIYASLTWLYASVPAVVIAALLTWNPQWLEAVVGNQTDPAAIVIIAISIGNIVVILLPTQFGVQHEKD